MRTKGKEGRKEGKKGTESPCETFHCQKLLRFINPVFCLPLSSDNWKVASVCTEPQGDRKHILAGLDRLDNGRKKEQMLSGDNSKRTSGGLQCVRVCAWVHNLLFMGKCEYVFARTCIFVWERPCMCVSFHAPFMLVPLQQRDQQTVCC